MLLDECVHRPSVTRILVGHEVRHVGPAGLAGLKDGALLSAAAAAGYELLLTTDRSMRHQQDVRKLPLRLLVVEANDTTQPGLQRLAGAIARAVNPESFWRLARIDNAGRLHVVEDEGSGRLP